MDSITIRIGLEADPGGDRRGVLINDRPSHAVDENEGQSVLNLARRGLWRSSESKGREIGKTLYRLFNGSGGELASLLAKS